MTKKHTENDQRCPTFIQNKKMTSRPKTSFDAFRTWKNTSQRQIGYFLDIFAARI